MRVHAACAAAAGLGLRLYFAWRFLMSGAGDSPLYEELARNWLNRGIYGIEVAGRLIPVDIRAPGYPAFLAILRRAGGHGNFPVACAQAILDIITCFLIARLAAQMAPEPSRRRTFLAALWLAVLCPFTANYTAAALSETLAIFFTALALCLLLAPGGIRELPQNARGRTLMITCLAGGLAAGFGTLVRPETPLLLAAVAMVILARCMRPMDWGKIARVGMLLGCGLVLPLLPWAARNWVTLHEVRFLAPRHAELQGEYYPAGFTAWTGTWLWRFHDVYLVPWKLEEEPIGIQDIPNPGFDSAEERARVTAMLEDYNDSTTMTPEMDSKFGKIARERTNRHPLRTYVKVPFLRACAMWLTPRVELLPFSGNLWPPGYAWEDDPVDFSVTAGFGALNLLYLLLAAWGTWKARHHPATAFLLAFMFVRTAFFTTVETPEPRYVLECFPAVIALAAQVWTRAAEERA